MLDGAVRRVGDGRGDGAHCLANVGESLRHVVEPIDDRHFERAVANVADLQIVAQMHAFDFVLVVLALVVAARVVNRIALTTVCKIESGHQTATKRDRFAIPTNVSINAIDLPEQIAAN